MWRVSRTVDSRPGIMEWRSLLGQVSQGAVVWNFIEIGGAMGMCARGTGEASRLAQLRQSRGSPKRLFGFR
jgi:hypothetical protein